MSPSLRVLATAVLLCSSAGTVAAQTTGQLVGRVVSARDSAPVANAGIVLPEWGSRGTTTTDPGGDFVIIGIPPGTYTVTVRAIGYSPTELRGVRVQAGVSTRLAVSLTPAVDLTPIRISEVERPLLTPEVSATRQVIGREDLASSPVQDIAQALELRTGVSDGHFRGGRVGQETYVIDGVEVKDQYAAARSGIAFQLAPSALQEVSVFTSGFSADQPSAVSGVVTLVSRSGPRERWFGRLEAVTDEGAPAALARGYARLGGSAGGPLWGGATAFFDLSLIGQADYDPRVAGLTCLPVAFPCPADRAIIPHQEGDRYFAFGRLDVPLGERFTATLSLSRNRDQHELYATRFKYALPAYLAERETASLTTLHLARTFPLPGAKALQVTTRLSLGRVDRYLGVPDTAQSARFGRFRLGDLRFRGEAFVRSSVREQVETGRTVPGYVQPSDSGLGSPYGIFGADLFVTDGTSGVAEWTRSEFANLRVDLQTLLSPQHELKLGGDLKLYRISAYQHVAAALAGAAANAVRFYPRTAALWLHNTLFALDAATIDLGVRVEAFQPRLSASTDRTTLTAPTATTTWSVLIHPRIGFAMPLGLVGLERASVRWNFGRFSQPPDFQFFFDQALDDSLNTAVRRQGNPNLGFERAIQYELGFDYLVTGDVVVRASGYLKDLSGLTTSGIALAGVGRSFTNLDFGRVEGFELRLEGRLDARRRFELGYVLQKAVGVVSTAFDSTGAPPDAEPIELPLQFDRRHGLDLNIFWPLPLGVRLAVGGSAGSGYPVPGAADRRLPWTVAVAARLLRDWQLGGRALRLLVEGRNLLGRANLVAARAGGGVLPDIAALEQRAIQETAGVQPIPRESPLYLPGFDADGNNFLDAAEQTAARRAALLDAFEPTLLYGEARQVRVGVEFVF